MVRDQAHAPHLTVITQTYGQPKMLDEWVRRHAQWDTPSREKTAVVVVDDHGDPAVEARDLAPLEGFASVDLYRVDRNIQWNQMGARNLAMLKAPSQVCVMLDIDMMIEAEDAPKFLETAETLKPGQVIKFCLRDLDRGGINCTSPNTWLLSQSDFLKAGGYNEDYAGHKGWSDVELLHVLSRGYHVVTRRDLIASWFSNCSQVPDALVKKLDRTVEINAGKHRAFKRQVDIRFGGNWFEWAKNSKRRLVRFPWSVWRVFP